MASSHRLEGYHNPPDVSSPMHQDRLLPRRYQIPYSAFSEGILSHFSLFSRHQRSVFYTSLHCLSFSWNVRRTSTLHSNLDITNYNRLATIIPQITFVAGCVFIFLKKHMQFCHKIVSISEIFPAKIQFFEILYLF